MTRPAHTPCGERAIPGTGSPCRPAKGSTTGWTGASVGGGWRRTGVGRGTVRNYLSTAIKKLGARNRVEAARLAERKGWL